jgi:aspartyl-tRNA(Asn)/glutamyl-tRNA(Gln) amidotransferase subunit A
MDHPGPIARCVRDLAILLQTIAGYDNTDLSSNYCLGTDLVASLAGEIKPPCLGRVRGLFEERAEPAVLQVMDEVERALVDQGCEVIDVALPAGFSEVIARHRMVMAVEAAQFHEQRLRKHPEDYGPNITALLKEGLACPAVEYARTKEHQRQLREQVADITCDDPHVLLCPATTGPAPDARTTGDPAFNSPWSYTGLPTISFPVGLSDDGLPLAIQLVGRGLELYEADLFRAALWCENALAGRMPEPPV